MIFSKTPQKTLDQAITNRDRLLIDVAKADKQLAAKSEAVDLTYDDADASEDERTKARAAKRDAEEAVKASRAALARAEAMIVKIRQEQAIAADKAQRAATAAEVEQDAAALARAAKAYLDGAAALAKITLKVATYVPEFANLNMVCNAAGMETPPLLEFGGKFMQAYSQGVLGGAYPATLPTAPAPIIPQAQIILPTKTVFATRNISWTNADGHLRMAKQWTEVVLPPEIADRALRMKCAVPLGDPIWKKQRGYQSMNNLTPDDCTNLDNNPPAVESDPRVTEPVKFEIIDRGGPRQFKVARSSPS
jgi:hypothetical protein